MDDFTNKTLPFVTTCSCIRLMAPKLTYDEVQAACLKCRSICSCKTCMFTFHDYTAPRFARPQLTEYANHILANLGKPLQQILFEMTSEVRSH
jgi:hypothetical protein